MKIHAIRQIDNLQSDITDYLANYPAVFAENANQAEIEKQAWSSVRYKLEEIKNLLEPKQPKITKLPNPKN